MNLGYSYKEMRHICKTYDIDYKSYIKVDTRKIDKNILLNEVLKNTKFMSTRALKNKLFKYNLKEKVCENCGLTDVWCGQPIVLELHHIDGNRYNNALDNLKILCPNCHSQQTHFRGNNKLSAAEKAKLTNVIPINKRIKKL